MFRTAEQNGSAQAGQQNHPVPKADQAPGCFVGDQRVSGSQQNRVQGQEPTEAGIGASQVLTQKTCRPTNNGQPEDQPLGPNRSFGVVEPKQPMQIKTPRMNVWRLSASTAEPRSIGAKRIERRVATHS